MEDSLSEDDESDFDDVEEFHGEFIEDVMGGAIDDYSGEQSAEITCQVPDTLASSRASVVESMSDKVKTSFRLVFERSVCRSRSLSPTPRSSRTCCDGRTSHRRAPSRDTFRNMTSRTSQGLSPREVPSNDCIRTRQPTDVADVDKADEPFDKKLTAHAIQDAVDVLSDEKVAEIDCFVSDTTDSDFSGESDELSEDDEASCSSVEENIPNSVPASAILSDLSCLPDVCATHFVSVLIDGAVDEFSADQVHDVEDIVAETADDSGGECIPTQVATAAVARWVQTAILAIPKILIESQTLGAASEQRARRSDDDTVLRFVINDELRTNVEQNGVYDGQLSEDTAPEDASVNSAEVIQQFVDGELPVQVGQGSMCTTAMREEVCAGEEVECVVAKYGSVETTAAEIEAACLVAEEELRIRSEESRLLDQAQALLQEELNSDTRAVAAEEAKAKDAEDEVAQFIAEEEAKFLCGNKSEHETRKPQRCHPLPVDQWTRTRRRIIGRVIRQPAPFQNDLKDCLEKEVPASCKHRGVMASKETRKKDHLSVAMQSFRMDTDPTSTSQNGRESSLVRDYNALGVQFYSIHDCDEMPISASQTYHDRLSETLVPTFTAASSYLPNDSVSAMDLDLGKIAMLRVPRAPSSPQRLPAAAFRSLSSQSQQQVVKSSSISWLHRSLATACRKQPGIVASPYSSRVVLPRQSFPTSIKRTVQMARAASGNQLAGQVF
jgi:hypothetical protein